MNISILYEDETLLVIDKPAGIAVNRSENEQGRETIQDWAERKIKNQKSKIKNESERNFYDRAGIVHRLDKDTSGLLVIAKNPTAFSHLQDQFKQRTVMKQYTALVHGELSAAEGTIQAPVGRLPWNRRKFGVLPTGREAATSYTVLSLHKKDTHAYTLVTVMPKTGRTHQIRIHFKHIGHSIVGDPLYAGKHVLEKDHAFCPRLFLHASYLQCTHPESLQSLELSSPLPPQLQQALSSLAY